jgi:hypothetical protein
VTLSGRVTYDRVPFAATRAGLDYAATVARPVREADVDLLQANQAVIGTTRTDTDGRYQFTSVPAATDVFVRVHARSRNDSSTSASWDIQVRDNTNANAQYVLDGATFNTGAANGTPTRDLNAPSGWPQFGGTSYVAPRSAGPFAILDTIYESAQLVIQQGDANQALAPLDIYWSPQNVPADGDPSQGEIGTTFYTSVGGAGLQPGIYVLGFDGLDTDEYDEHVLAHEFNHFLEDTVGRADSPGGSHGQGDRLDLRVAWSEGMSDAFSAMALGDPVYRDSFGQSQADEFGFDMDSNVHDNAGWFSEASVYSIAWDLFDDGAEANDAAALGYGPLFDVLRSDLRTSTALTSLFPFVTALKTRSGVDAASVDALVQAQGIVATSMDAFGSTETHNGGNADALPIYTDIALNGPAVVVCGNADAGTVNALGNRRFLRFNVPGDRVIDVRIRPPLVGQAALDPDLVVWRSGFFAISDCAGVDPQAGCTEQQSAERFQESVPAGDYVLEVYDYNHIDPATANPPRSCMSVTVNG